MFKNIQTLIDRIIKTSGSIHGAKQLLSSWYKNGRFSTSLAYDWLRVKHDRKPWMTLIWKSYVPPKYSFILWLAMRGRLNTKDIWFEQPEDISCVFSKRSKNSISHFLFQCTFVKSIWNKLRSWLNIRRPMNTLLSTVKWIKKEYRGALFKSKAMLLTFAVMVYTIWNYRNKTLFAGCCLLIHGDLEVHSNFNSNCYPCSLSG